MVLMYGVSNWISYTALVFVCGRSGVMCAGYFYLVKHDYVLGLDWFSLLSIAWIALKLCLFLG